MGKSYKDIRNPANKPKHLPTSLVKVALPDNNQSGRGKNERAMRQERAEIKRAGRRVMRRRQSFVACDTCSGVGRTIGVDPETSSSVWIVCPDCDGVGGASRG